MGSCAGVNTSFTGVENYCELIGDDLFWQAFQVGLIWAYTVTILQFLLGMGSRCCSTRRCGSAASPG